MDRRVRSAVTAVVAVVLLPVTPADAAPLDAAFPGRNGLIAFERELVAGDHTQTDVWTVRPDGTHLRELTHSRGHNEFGPAWNPQGTRIAFWRTPAPFGPGTLFVANADGSGRRQLTTGIDARDPAWNPEGTRLVFTRFGPDGADLWSLRASDGGDLRQVTSGPDDDVEPAWSPDGTAIAFSRQTPGVEGGDVLVLDTATGTLTSVAHSTAFLHQVAWRPSGTELVYESDLARTSALFAVRPDGSGRHQLTGGRSFDVGPAPAPDGTALVFGSLRPDRFFPQLWVAGPDGGHLHLLVATAGGASVPDWQPG